MKKRQVALLRIVALALVALLVVPVSVVPEAASAATLYWQPISSTLGDQRNAHPGFYLIQKLGTGLNGTVGSVAYRANGSAIDTEVAGGFGEVKLFACFSDSYAVCPEVANSSFTPQILSQSGNDATVLVKLVDKNNGLVYSFNSDLYYYLKWITRDFGDFAVYGSSADTYTNGLAQWFDNTVFNSDANVLDLAFNLCDGATCDLEVDITPPVVTIDSGPSEGGLASTTPVSFSFTASDAHLSGTTCSWDGAASAACTSPASAALADGSHTFSVTASDLYGNSTTAPTRTFSVDTTAPVLVESAAIPTATDTTPDYTFTSTEAGTLALSGGCGTAATTAGVGSNTITLSALAVGTYNSCSLSVTDTAGNTGTLPLSPFTIEAVPVPEPAPAPSGGGGGGGFGGVLSGPLSVGYQTPYTPPPAPAPATPEPQPAQATVSAPVGTVSTASTPVVPAQSTDSSVRVISDVQTTSPEPAPTDAPVAVVTPWDTPAGEQITANLAAAAATSGFQLPNWLLILAALLLALLGIIAWSLRRRSA